MLFFKQTSLGDALRVGERQAQKLMPGATGKALWQLWWPCRCCKEWECLSPEAALRGRNSSQFGKEETWELVFPASELDT